MTHPIQDHTADWLDELFDGMTVDPATGEIIATDHPPTEVVADLTSDLDSRIDGYANTLRRLDANAKVCAEEAERFSIRQRIFENRAKRLREWIAYSMALSGRTKVATAKTTATIVQNGGAVPLDIHEPAEAIPLEYVTTELVVKPNREKIRAALEAGEELPFARLMERGSHLRIK